jgi:hypothetical protein
MWGIVVHHLPRVVIRVFFLEVFLDISSLLRKFRIEVSGE